MQLVVPKQARSVATRARLVEAAASTLVEHGFAGTSTNVIAEAAGVSQGALFKHFPVKSQLLAACVEKILGGMVADFHRAMQRRQAGAATIEERVKPAVAALWKIFRRADMHAVFEVYVAARTDVTLGEELAPILAAHRENILREARALFPELATVRLADDAFDMAVDAVVYAMQGVVLDLFGPDARDDRKHVAFFERLALRELEAALRGVK